MATNPYTSQSSSGYNSSPPSDDGSATEANRIKWSTIRTKLSDVLKTFTEAVDAAVLAAFAKTINIDANENNAMAGSLAFTSSELTIATGAVTVTRSHHTIDTESDAASDDLDTMATGSVSDGAIVVLRAQNTARTVVVKHEAGGAGQFHIGADITLDDTDKSLVVQRRGADWYLFAVGTNASQANMEADSTTDLVVTTGVFRHQPGVAKVTINFDGTGTISINVSHNVTSITDGGTGIYDINIATDFSSANYVPNGMARAVVTNDPTIVVIDDSTAPAAGVLRINTINDSSALVDSDIICVSIDGDQ